MYRILTSAGNGLLRCANAEAAIFPANRSLHLSTKRLTGYVPAYVKCEKGKTVMWCACGHSNKQPLCDGSHKTRGNGKTPLAFIAPEEKEYLMCTCKQTKKKPMCDGSQGGCRSFV